VVNDQKVTVGTPLATIDPKPFDLAVDLSQRRVDQAASAARGKQDETHVRTAELDAAKAAVILAQQDYQRSVAAALIEPLVARAIRLMMRQWRTL
jgi:membrane fusion protein, multidrug efflux system